MACTIVLWIIIFCYEFVYLLFHVYNRCIMCMMFYLCLIFWCYCSRFVVNFIDLFIYFCIFHILWLYSRPLWKTAFLADRKHFIPWLNKINKQANKFRISVWKLAFLRIHGYKNKTKDISNIRLTKMAYVYNVLRKAVKHIHKFNLTIIYLWI